MNLASAITLTGQAIIQNNENVVNKYGVSLGTLEEPAIKVIAGDTDSVVGSSVITVNGTPITIAEYHDSLTDIVSTYDTGGDVRRGVGVGNSFNVDAMIPEQARIVYSMKHKVKKKLYRIRVGRSFVDVTEDHSVEVIDKDGNLVSRKPTEIKETDRGIIELGTALLPITVECLGETEEYVYDIEVEGNHNFFANGILVHNSNYIDFSNLMKQFSHVPVEKQVDILDKFCEQKVAAVIAKGMAEISEDTNFKVNRLYMKRESIAKAVIVAKKRFVFEVYDMEGVRYATPEQKVTGLESQRSSTPAWCRERLKTAYELFFHGSEGELQKFVKKTRTDYFEIELKNIAAASSANGLGKWLDNGSPIKGTPFHIKGVAAYNRIITAKGLGGKYPMIQSGDKIKVVNLTMPNPAKSESLAFADKIPPEMGIEAFVDRSAMFTKFFLEPLQRVADIVGWSCERRFVL